MSNPANKSDNGASVQPMVGRRRLGKIELLKGIEAELRKEIQWLEEHDPKNESDAMRGAKYAYKKTIKALRKYHVGWPLCR